MPGTVKPRHPALGAVGADTEEDRFFGGDSAEVVETRAEWGVEVFGALGVGEGAVGGPVEGGHGGV